MTRSPDDVTLRSGRASDLPAAAALWAEGWRDAHLDHAPPGLVEHRGPPQLERLLTQRLDLLTVAVREGGLVGFHVVRGDELEQLYVAPEARGTGLAERLIADAEQRIAVDHDTAWLAVTAGNARARRFYARVGWRDAGAFTYRADTGAGSFAVPCHRCEKRVRAR